MTEKKNIWKSRPLKAKYEAPALKPFSYDSLQFEAGFSGLDCPPRDPVYRDDYGEVE